MGKAVQYGANSMKELGYDLGGLQQRDVSAEEAQELACYFYIRGKMGRWKDAIMRGERPSDDTILDIGVYARMVQRIRDAGGWPGV